MTKETPRDEKGTVSLDKFVEEEARFLGRIPLDKFKAYLEKKAEEGIVRIDFHAVGYVTDAVLRVLRDVLCNKAKADKYLSQLTSVDLTACFNVTDTGIGWLADVVRLAPKIKNVTLDQCLNVTDGGLAAVLNAQQSGEVSAIAACISNISLDFATQGCPLLIDQKYSSQYEELLYGHSVIVPHSRVEHSISDYLETKKVNSRKDRPLCYVKGWSVKKWELNLTEMELGNPLFDVLVPQNPALVIIPFDTSSEVKEVRSHIANTITRVLAKESIKPGFQKDKTMSSPKNKFMDVHHYARLYLSQDGLLRSISKISGLYTSRQPLSRSNPYFQVTCVKITDRTADSSIILGCMFDAQFKASAIPSPTATTASATLFVEKFELREGDVMRFGVSGEWESEYVPKEDDCKFYCIRNGYLVLNTNTKFLPRVGMYPLVTISGTGVSEVRLDNYKPNKTSVKRDKVIFEPGYVDYLQYSEDGVLTQVEDQIGLCVSRIPISKSNNSCTIKILTQGKTTFGIGRENMVSRRSMGSGDDTLGMRAEDGKVYYQNQHSHKSGDGLVVEPERWKAGDEITMTVSGFERDIMYSSDQVKVEFSINGKKVCETMYKFSSTYGNRCVFMVTLHTKGERVKVVNFGQPFYQEPPVKDKLTMGRCNQMMVFDDGTLECVHTNGATGLYQSKTPINKSLPYFEMELGPVQNSGKRIYLGLCTWFQQVDKKYGSMQLSIGYEGGNPRLYNSTKTTETGFKEKMVEGDVIGCGVTVEKTKFKSDGSLETNQELEVYFTRNGTKIISEVMTYCGDGLYPCVTLCDPIFKVKLRNFYPSCFQPGYKNEDSETKKKTVKNKADVGTEGCQFVIVGVGGEKAKVEQVKGQLNLEQDLTLISKLKTEIQRLEKDLGSLDFQTQNYYSRAWWQLQCLERLCHHGDRLHFTSLNTQSGEGYDSLLETMTGIFEGHKARYPLQYNVHASIKTGLDAMVQSVQSKVISVKADDSAKKSFNNSNLFFAPVMKLLHFMGRVLCVRMNSELYAIDYKYVMKELCEKLVKLNDKKALKGHKVTSVGETTLLWTWDSIVTNRNWNIPERFELMKNLAHQIGVLKLQPLRTEVNSGQYFYTRMEHVNSTAKMSDYWSQGTRLKDTVTLWRTYQFWSGMPSALLSMLITMCSQYARVLVVTQDGGVFQNGAVQTAIVYQKKDGHESVTVESRCYVPDADMGSINAETRYHVEEYTWNIFCLLADVIDGHLESCGITPIIKQNLYDKFGNKSIGCKHEWVVSDAEIVQSVCTLCDLCCDTGQACKWNGIVGHYLRQCQCGTKVSGCKSCGICKRCAEHLWMLRSMLRPCCEVIQGTSKDPSDLIPLNGATFNQAKFIKLKSGTFPICLKKLEDQSESLIQVYPGTATEYKELKKLISVNKQTTYSGTAASNCGDHLSITLTLLQRDPNTTEEEEQEEDAILDVKPVYNASISRDVRVWHDTGIVCYDCIANRPAHFIAAKPLTPDCNRFTIEIVSVGGNKSIYVGLVNRHYPADKPIGHAPVSYGYNAEYGSIYISTNVKKDTVTKCAKGDWITCELDFDGGKIIFYKGDEKVYTAEEVSIPLGGFFPAISIKSDGEAVKLRDVDPWQPPTHGETPPAPNAFDTYKYGNLWISPGRLVYLQKTVSSNMAGWLLLHNPTDDPVGCMIKSDQDVINKTEMIEAHESKTIWIHNLGNSVQSKLKSQAAVIEISWFNLSSGKSYSISEIQKAMKALTPDQYHGHLLQTKVLQEEKEIDTLRRASAGRAKKDMYELQVKKNDVLVERYYLKGGNYACVLPTDEHIGNGWHMISPKHPTFNLPKGFHRGMRLIAQMAKNQFHECVVTFCDADVTNITLEFTPKKSEENETITLTTASKDIQLEKLPMKSVEVIIESEVKDDKGDNLPPKKQVVMQPNIVIQEYDAKDNVSMVKRGLLFPPPYLLSSASRQAISALNSRWINDSLESVSKCDTLPTRITVQELQISELSRGLSSWVRGRNKDGNSDQAFAYLPSSLNTEKLLRCSIKHLFKDLQVHRLCFLQKQLSATSPSWLPKMHIDVPLHMVDIPPMTPMIPLPPDLMFASLFSGWTYTALVATKIKLPVYDKLISVDKTFNKNQVEILLGSLLRIYTAQCHIMAEQHGGLDLQVPYAKYSELVQKTIEHTDKSVVTFEGKLSENPAMLMKHEKSQVVYCKAHQLVSDNTGTWEKDQAVDLPYEHKYFEPYQDTVNFFHRNMKTQKSLPDDFFEKMSNLEFFGVKKCQNMTAIPAGISKCQNLKVVVVGNGSIESMSKDLFMAPELAYLSLTNMPLRSLPTEWPTSTKLTRLILNGLQLTSVPPEICSLTQLTRLSLSNNPLVDIPHQFKKLQKLKYLNLSGVPWLINTTNRPMTKDTYKKWIASHPEIKTYLKDLDMDQLFEDHDLNRNGMLDDDELSALNEALFWKIPRLGSHCITDQEFGGIPPAVFQIPSLEELHINYTAITSIPVHMCRLVNLKRLNLAYNPLLDSLPGSVGHMPYLKEMNVHHCASLRTPPTEVVSRGFESVKAYLKRLAGGFTACRRTKLMLVGLGGAGKTSLLKALMSDKKKTAGTKGENITDGIAIQQWKVSCKNNEEISYSAWDFAGQTLYYNTHQFFLSKRAVYLLLWSTRQGFEHAGLDFWLSSIACHAPKTPIFIIGTHCDEVWKADIPKAELMQTFPQIVGFHFVSSLEGTGIAELEDQLLKVTLEQKNMGEKIPQVWLNLETKILAAREKTSILPWKDIKAYGMEVGLYDDKDVKEALEFLHELGTVQYFDNEFLRDRVVINPQWIVNVMSCVVSVKNSPIQKHQGKLYHKDLGAVWKEYPKTLHKWLMQLTEVFDLTFPLPKDPINIVPCLLPPEQPKELDWPSIPRDSDIRQTKMMYKFSYLPAGLFNRAQVRLFQLSDSNVIWKRGSLLKKNNHLALIRQTNNFDLVVLVQGPRPENILFLIHEIFESLIDESFNGVIYDFLVPCPDCVLKEGCLDPSLFDSELVYAARDHKAPFLQCRKYFHTVSMSQLIESMPDSQGGDFDASLQHSIMMLQELNTALTTDVAVLYSASDIPGPRDSDKINPLSVKKDLEKMGHSVWFCDDMKNASVQDLTLGLKNCKIVVALVSDNFEKDPKSRDMMFYTMNILHKDYVVVVCGSGNAWQNTDLGMRIGKHELMVMARTKSRYQEKVKELQGLVSEKMHGSATQSKEYPVCFISYCWSNSRGAVKQGTKARPGSVGWGDPRELKKHLEEGGVSTWIDTEQMVAGKGLFENITKGMRYAKVLVACVSDEYAESVNCMMELRFGVLNLGLPLVVAVVGTGNEWLYSEAAALAQRAKADRVYLQEESKTSFKTVLKHVKDRLPDKSDSLMRKEALKQEINELQKKAATSQTSVAFKEEYELTQRRFMRHIISFVSSMDTNPMPRLVVIDFDQPEDKLEKDADNSAKKPGTPRPTMRPKTASKTRDRIELTNPDEEDWESEPLCVKIMCEFEEGWHLCENSFPLKKTDDLHSKLKKVAPYLFRIFGILRQSSVQLNCFSGDVAKKFMDWLEDESQGCDFLEAYQAMQSIISDNLESAKAFMAQLCRCHLPSGKIFWLCKSHQAGPRITKLSEDVGTRHSQHKIVVQSDILLKEQIEKGDTYKKKSTEKSKIKKIDLSSEEDKEKSVKLAQMKMTVKPSESNNEKGSEELIPHKKEKPSSDKTTQEGIKEDQTKAGEKKSNYKTTKQPVEDKKSTSDKKPSSADKKSSTNKAQPTDEKKTTNQDKKDSSSNKTPPTKDNKPSTTDKKPTVEDKKAATQDKKPTVEDKKAATQDKKPTVEDKKPTTSQDKKPSSSNSKPSSGGKATNPKSNGKDGDKNDPSKACSIQ